jgi:hypothetical protein
MKRQVIACLAMSLLILGAQPSVAQGINKTNASKTGTKRCFILLEDLISKLKVYSRPTEHYHKVKGHYTWQETVSTPFELEGSGEFEVRCE